MNFVVPALPTTWRKEKEEGITCSTCYCLPYSFMLPGLPSSSSTMVGCVHYTFHHPHARSACHHRRDRTMLPSSSFPAPCLWRHATLPSHAFPSSSLLLLLLLVYSSTVPLFQEKFNSATLYLSHHACQDVVACVICLDTVVSPLAFYPPVVLPATHPTACLFWRLPWFSSRSWLPVLSLPAPASLLPSHPPTAFPGHLGFCPSVLVAPTASYCLGGWVLAAAYTRACALLT